MYKLLSGLRVIEAASFVAAPYCTMMLAQLGAEVIRIDPIGGAPDYRRWPVSAQGDSFYWEALNKGKKSVSIDMRSAQGRELVQKLAVAGGEEGGVFVTNFPATGFLSYDALRELRADLICARIMGWADGSQAVDYTVNCAVGMPNMTGPADADTPVNHVLPIWDLLAGATAAMSIQAAVQRRRETGAGQELRVPLGDLAAATVANLGNLAEVTVNDSDRPRYGNSLFGAFGRDFVTGCGKRLMIVGLTRKQWLAIVSSLQLEMPVATLEADHGVQFADDPGLRFEYRVQLEALVEQGMAAETWEVLEPRLRHNAVCFGPYQTLHEASRHDPLFTDNPIFSTVQNPSGYSYPVPGFPASFSGEERQPPVVASPLGSHTHEVLSTLLDLSDGEISRLEGSGIVAAAVQS